MPRKIYVASSWRTPAHEDVVKFLREAGHQVFNYRDRADFSEAMVKEWSQFDWTKENGLTQSMALDLPHASTVYRRDKSGMDWADTCVLVLPSGRSAALEAGWFAGKGIPTFALTTGSQEPELMLKLLAPGFCHSKGQLINQLGMLG